jgi:hypothetical protein
MCRKKLRLAFPSVEPVEAHEKNNPLLFVFETYMSFL